MKKFDLNNFDYQAFMNSDEPQFDADFESGSLGSMTKLGKNWYHINLRNDTWYNFCFRVKGCKGKEIIFEFSCDNLLHELENEGRYRWLFNDGKYVNPLVSYDGESWQKIGNIEKIHTFIGKYRFSHFFTEDEAYICHQVPYTYTKLIKWIKSLENAPCVDTEIIGYTRNGVAEPAITLSNVKGNGQMVVIIGREDADETGGSFGIEGLVDYIMNTRSDLLDKFIFKIVPMVGIEGAICGACHSAGYGYSGFQWHKEKAPAEIRNVKDAIKRWVDEGNNLVMAGKLHGATNPHVNVGLDDIMGCDENMCNLLRKGISEYFNGEWQPGSWGPNNSFLLGKPFPAMNRPEGYFERYIVDEYGVKNVFGLHIQEGYPETAFEGGRGLMQGVAEFLDTLTK